MIEPAKRALWVLGIIIFALAIYFIILKFKLAFTVKDIEKDIRKQNSSVKYVHIFGYEDFLPLSDAVAVIRFEDNGSLILRNINEKQNGIVFDSCNGYQFFVFGRFVSNSTPKNFFTGSFFSNSFYEKLFGIPLQNINDFVQGYELIKEYMNNLTEIPFVENQKLTQENISQNFEDLEKEGMPLHDENVDYLVFKQRIPAMEEYIPRAIDHVMKGTF
jgi:hypothetical protein